jgi:putative oxidoreductase
MRVVEPIDITLAVLRVWAGIVMLMHGINHGRTQEGTAQWFEKIGFSQAKLNARLSFLSEIAIGLGLIVGLLTSVAAAALVATMFVAFWTVHRFAGFYVFHRPDEGYEYVVTLALVATAIAYLGPGEYSLDTSLGIDLSGTTGLLIVAGGLLAALGQVMVLWRRPTRV